MTQTFSPSSKTSRCRSGSGEGQQGFRPGEEVQGPATLIAAKFVAFSCSQLRWNLLVCFDTCAVLVQTILD